MVSLAIRFGHCLCLGVCCFDFIMIVFFILFLFFIRTASAAASAVDSMQIYYDRDCVISTLQNYVIPPSQCPVVVNSCSLANQTTFTNYYLCFYTDSSGLQHQFDVEIGH